MHFVFSHRADEVARLWIYSLKKLMARIDSSAARKVGDGEYVLQEFQSYIKVMLFVHRPYVCDSLTKSFLSWRIFK